MKLNSMAMALLGAAVLGSAPLTAMASVDLTASCGLSGTVGDAIFSNPCNENTVGTGVINPFLTIQQNGSEGGFNTDFLKLQDVVAPSPFDSNDAKRGGADGKGGFTSSLLLGSIGTVDVGGTAYRKFVLDINESNNADRFLSLDRLMVSVGGTGNSGDLQDVIPATLPLIYDLGTGNSILMDYNLNSGSGKGDDLTILILSSLFGTDDTQFVNLFAEFGLTGQVGTGQDARDYGSSDGFEEFYALNATPIDCTLTPDDPSCQPPPPPSSTGNVSEPSSSALAFLGLGLIGFSFWRRQRTRDV